MWSICVHRSIKKFTDAYKEKKYPLHVLLNNAAIQSPKGKRGAKTEDGFEVCTDLEWMSHICQSSETCYKHGHLNSVVTLLCMLISLLYKLSHAAW